MVKNFPDVLEETVITLDEVRNHLPRGGISRSGVERWIRKGTRGAILESACIGNRRYTSVEAVQRFLERSNRPKAEEGKPAFPRRTRAELERKKKELGLA